MNAVRLGLNAVSAVTRKELYSYLVSPMAYVVTAVFLLVNGFIFFLIIASPQAEASLRPMLPTTAFLLLLIIPVLTMRLPFLGAGTEGTQVRPFRTLGSQALLDVRTA